MGRKTTLWRCAPDAWGPMVVAASKAGRRAGVSSALGWLAGPGAAARASWAGLLGRLLLRAS